VFQSLQQHVTVFGTAVHDDVVVGLIQEQDLVALVNDGFYGTGVTGLDTYVTEYEQQVTVVVIREDLGTLFVDDGPGTFRTYSGIDDLGSAGDGGSGQVGDGNFTGRGPETGTLHNVGTGCVQLLNGSVVGRSGLAPDSVLLLAFVDGGGGYVNEVVFIDGDVVKFSGDVFFTLCSLFVGLDLSPQNFQSTDGNLLSTDKSEEVGVVVDYDDTLIGGGRYHEQSAVLVNRTGNGLVDGAFFKQVGFRLLDDLFVVPFQVEHNDTVVVGIAYVDVFFVYEHAGGVVELVGNTMFVGEFLDFKLELVVAVAHQHTVAGSVYQVHLQVGPDKQVSRVIECHFQAHVCRVYHLVRHVCGRRSQNSLAVCGVGVGCVGGRCAEHGGYDGEDCHSGSQTGKESCLDIFHSILLNPSYRWNPWFQ